MKIKFTKQRDISGCGLACVANITNSSYYDIRRLALEKKQLSYLDIENVKYGTLSKNLRSLLRHKGVKSLKQRNVKYWESIKRISIVGINKKKSGNWHWVVYYPKQKIVMDPYNGIRTDLGRMRLSFYIPILIKGE